MVFLSCVLFAKVCAIPPKIETNNAIRHQKEAFYYLLTMIKTT